MLFFSRKLTLQEFATEVYFRHVEKKPRSVDEDRGLLGLRERKAGGRKPTRTILAELGSKRIDRITRADMMALHARWRSTPVRANRALALLSHMFAVAERLELRVGNPTRGVPRYRERHRQRFLDAEELSRLGAALTGSAEDTSIRLLYLTGLRPSELFGARREDIDFARGLLRLRDSKVGAREVPISSAALDILRGFPPGAMFEPGIGGRVSRRWKALRSVLSLDGVRLYDSRHSFASWALAQGASLPLIGAILGHQSPATTARYAHVSEHDARQLADATGEKLSEFLGG